MGLAPPDAPPLAVDAVAQLNALEAQCTPSEHKVRADAFPQARRYIKSHEGHGVDPPVSKSCYDRDRSGNAKDARVDIEVIFGRAFT